ncbi:MAG: ferrous iron transport protein A [Clostridiaceae bacterium]|nr:ferrous iron transport protein A [Clostridiaceae bacterium]
MNTEFHSLAQIAPGHTVRVRKLHLSGAIRQRLLDLGLIEGTRVQCLNRSPAGDPTAYLIRGAVIALRGKDSSKIEVFECR